MSVVVASRPSGSPLNWYGALNSVHRLLPSIQNSIEEAAQAPTLAVQATAPDSCCPVRMLDVTVKAVAAARAGAIPRVSVAAITATRLIRRAERPKARDGEGSISLAAWGDGREGGAYRGRLPLAAGH